MGSQKVAYFTHPKGTPLENLQIEAYPTFMGATGQFLDFGTFQVFRDLSPDSSQGPLKLASIFPQTLKNRSRTSQNPLKSAQI